MTPQPKQQQAFAASVLQGTTQTQRTSDHLNQLVIKGGNQYFYNEQPPSKEELQTSTQINALNQIPVPNMPLPKLHKLLSLSQMGFRDIISQQKELSKITTDEPEPPYVLQPSAFY